MYTTIAAMRLGSDSGMKKTLAGWLVSEKIVLLRANKYSPIMDDYYAETINS